MTNPERRDYRITGEVPAPDWELALQLLGRLGITVGALDPDSVTSPTAATLDTIEAGTLPYQLSEIHSRGQYLAPEHAEQFWPTYRDSAKASGKRLGSKSSCLYVALPVLLHPQSREKSVRFSKDQSLRYAEGMGLKLVRPRSIVGFSNEKASSSYGTLYGDNADQATVLEVGSFLDFMKQAPSLAPEERPHMLNSIELRFLSALASHLEAQIDASDEPLAQ